MGCVNLDQMQFKYRAEGNANLVLALPQTRQVLRLKKTQIGGDVQQQQQQLSPNAVDSNYCALIEYIRAISGLFSSCFIIEPQLVFCVLKDLDVFNKQLNMVRPGKDSFCNDIPRLFNFRCVEYLQSIAYPRSSDIRSE